MANKANNKKPQVSKANGAKPSQKTETKVTDTKKPEVKAAETKQAAAKPVEAKPAESKPVEKKPVENKPAEAPVAHITPASEVKEKTLDKKEKTTWEKNQFKWGWIFILPTMIGIIVLNLWPIIQTIWQSFCKVAKFGGGNKFVGFENYTKMFADSEVWQSLLNTFKYAIIEVPFSIAIALVLAVFLNRKMHGRTVYRAIFFLPMVVAPAAVAMVWRWLYNSQFGLINHILGKNIEWISNPKIAWVSVAIIGVWSIIGYNMVLFLAGLQEIPKDYYEAADIDGASGVRAFFKITLPLLSPTVFFVLVTRIIGAFQVFDLVYMVMDISNPALSKTQSIVYLFYQYSFTNGNKGYGSAIVVLLLAVIMVVTVIQMIGQKKWVHYN